MEEGVTKIKGEEHNEEEEEQDYNPNGSIFDRVKLTLESYDYFVNSLGETLETTPYEDFVEFVVDTKLKYGALIVTEYGDYVDYFSDKETMTLLNKLYLITDIFLFDAKEALSNFKKHYEILTKENSKKFINLVIYKLIIILSVIMNIHILKIKKLMNKKKITRMKIIMKILKNTKKKMKMKMRMNI